MSRTYYWDKETHEFIEGYPPSKNKYYGQAPFVITDTMDKHYHPAIGKFVDSKKAWDDIDRACGTVTSGKKQSPDPTWQNEQRKKRHADLRESMLKSIAQIDNGTAPLSEQKREWCKQENERLANLGVINPYNVVGRKKNLKGKRYGRRR